MMKLKFVYSILSLLTSLLSLSFASYVLLKANFLERLDHLSGVSIFAATLGVSALIPSVIDDKKFLGNALQICSNLMSLLLSFSVLLFSFTQYQHFEKFMIEEISKLWTLRDTSDFYRGIIRFLAETVDCCKTHHLVRIFLIYISTRLVFTIF
jgi:hypothetical protein